MADRYKILGQVSFIGTVVRPGYETLYEVPSASAVVVGNAEVAPKATSQIVQTLVTNIYVCNKGGVQCFTSLTLQSGEAGSTEFKFMDFGTVLAKETKVLSLGLTLSTGDVITCEGSGVFGTAYDVDFTCFGVETTSGSGPDV